MALTLVERRKLLARNIPETKDVVRRLAEYMSRSGLALGDIARRVGYATRSLSFFVSGKYEMVAANDARMRAALIDFMDAHPVAVDNEQVIGNLYETENVKLLRTYFYDALDHSRAIYVHGAPGSQKSYVAKHLIAELNKIDLSKNGHGRRAYYIYCRQNIRPLDLLKRVAQSVGALADGGVDRVLRNLRFEFGGRKVLLLFDESQHLSVECLEIIRELFDEPPHCGLLFLGSHQLQTAFIKNSLELEQWNSRFHFGMSLPGISEAEALDIIRAELGSSANDKITRKLINDSRATDLRKGGEHEYISARRLFWSLKDISAKLSAARKKKGDQE